MKQKTFSSIFSIQSSILFIFVIGLTLNSSCDCSLDPIDPCIKAMERCETLEAQHYTDHYTIAISPEYFDSLLISLDTLLDPIDPNSNNLVLAQFVQEQLTDMYANVDGEEVNLSESCGCGIFSISVDESIPNINIEDRVTSAKSRLEQNGEMGIAELDYPIDLIQPGSFLPSIPKIVKDTIPIYQGTPSIKNKTVKVAIIDTGGQPDHSNLKNHMWENDDAPSNNDDDGNCFMDDHTGYDFIRKQALFNDERGHGTHVTGIVVDNVTGVVFNNPLDDIQLQVMNLKAIGGDGGSVRTLRCALDYAIDEGAEIINLSLGYYSKHESQILKEAVIRAQTNEIIIVASAGNDNMKTDCGCHHLPDYFSKDFENVVSVAALDVITNVIPAEYKLANYSNYGSYVDIAAVGTNISSSFPPQTTKFLSGTSMAAPAVTSELAKIKANTGQTNAAIIINQLFNNQTGTMNPTPNLTLPPKETRINKYLIDQ